MTSTASRAGWAPRAPERPGDVRRDAYAGLHDAVRAAGAALAESEGSVLPVEVPATALVPDARTPGLAAALAAGRFTVTGFAVFDPARPFDPTPAARAQAAVEAAGGGIVPVGGAPAESLAATELVEGRQRGFTYPDDVQ